MKEVVRDWFYFVWAHPLSTSVTIEMMLYVLMVKEWEYKLYPPKSLLSLSSIWHLIQNPVEIINFNNEIKKKCTFIVVVQKIFIISRRFSMVDEMAKWNASKLAIILELKKNFGFSFCTANFFLLKRTLYLVYFDINQRAFIRLGGKCSTKWYKN